MTTLIYEVTVAVDADVADAYRTWLDGHIPEVLAAGGFDHAAIYNVAEAPADGRRHLVVQYHVPDRAALDAYVAGPAERLRADAETRFGGRFEARRRVLVLSSIPADADDRG